MKKFLVLIISYLLISFNIQSQSIIWQKEDVIALTSKWTGERLSDGRPKVSDDLLERLKKLGMADVWDVLRTKGYLDQFENFNGTYENPWMVLHPDQVMTGRVLTTQFMPARPDLGDYVQEQGKKDGSKFRITNSTPINILQEGDVFVADGYGKVIYGTLIGDNLGNAIWNATKRGFIFNAGIRDWEGNMEIKGFNGWYRGTDPSAIRDMTVTSVNGPIRIGRATVLPGDVVLARKNGVTFIPAYLVQEVVERGEFISLRTEFSKQRVSEGKYEYKNEQFVGGWTQTIQDDFINWLNHYPNLPMDRKNLDKYLKEIKIAK